MVLNYPGPRPPAVMKTFDCDKIVDGSIRYSGDMTEDDIRQEVARIIWKKHCEKRMLYTVFTISLKFNYGLR